MVGSRISEGRVVSGENIASAELEAIMGLGVLPPSAASRGRAPGKRVRRLRPMKLKAF